ncbi:MAG TPA: ABC transporter ATP-binding protein [Trebonia sp.]|nr:ABC transporter ATP-binding protein [Trebonia sp.]
MYELTGVSKVYRSGSRTVRAVCDVGLTVADGEWVAIRGRTGHGKSTLLNLLGGLDRPTSGQLRLDGRDLGRMGDAELTRLRALAIGFVFQTFNLVPTLSAAENVEAALVPLRIGSAERRRRAAAALDSVGLADRSRHLPSELSGGQQQRVAIARALVKEPRVVLADEPTGNLDEDTRDEIIDLLAKLWRDRGLTLVLVSHDGAVVRHAQRVGVMSRGRLSFGSRSARLPLSAAPAQRRGRAFARRPMRARRARARAARRGLRAARRGSSATSACNPVRSRSTWERISPRSGHSLLTPSAAVRGSSMSASRSCCRCTSASWSASSDSSRSFPDGHSCTSLP